MRRPMIPTDLYRLESVGEVALRPGSNAVWFTITWADQATDENRSVIHTHDGDRTAVFVGGHKERHLRFSPGGEQLAFLSSAPDEPAQVHVANVDSGAVVLRTELADGARSVEWLDDHRLLARADWRLPAQSGLDDDELARTPRVIRSLDYRSNARGWAHDRPRAVLEIDVSTGASKTVTDPTWDCSAAMASATGDQVLVVAPTDHDADITGANRVWIVDPNLQESRCLSPGGWSWEAVGWTTDGRPWATGAQASEIGFHRPYVLDLEGRHDPTPVGHHDVNCTSIMGAPIPPVALEGALVCPGIRGGSISLDRYDLTTGDLTTIASGPFTIGSFAASPADDRIVAGVSTPTRPAELWQFEPDGSHTVLHQLNVDLLAELDLSEPEVVEIDTTDGVTVEAFVIRPPASVRAPGSGPGLVYVHGGPTAAYGHRFFDEFQLAAAAGYTVIGGNPRGSDGYGEDWARSVVGRLGTVDWEDVSALADWLADDDAVDADRIGIGGGSYGGFMAAWATGHTDRFRAALVERCVVNWHSFAGTSDIGPYFTKRLLGVSVEDDIDAIFRQSPLTYAANNTTPTLILHSEEDWRCPPEQAEQLFAAYRRNGVDTTFVRFPGETHELTRSGAPRHRVERFEIVHEFFDRWLKR